MTIAKQSFGPWCLDTVNQGRLFQVCYVYCAHLILIHPQYVFINARFNCKCELFFPCHSVTLALYFGAPALEELAVLNFLSTPPTCYLSELTQLCGWVVTAVVDTGRRAACRKHSLTSFQDCCWRLENITSRRVYRAVILSLYLALFDIIPLFRWHVVSIILQCFKTC